MDTPGFHRRLLIEPAPRQVTAELEDDWHRMFVRLHHENGIVIRVESDMKRAPWTTCPGAMERLKATFEGEALSGVAGRGEKTKNCTHLHDLVLFAAAHAPESTASTYDIFVSDPVEGRRDARLRRNAASTLEWRIDGDRLVSPFEVAGRRLTELGDWIAGLDRQAQEAARMLRWATMMSFGRQLNIPARSSAARFATGACFTFQPERAESATRVPWAQVDFSGAAYQPLADRGAAFRNSRPSTEGVSNAS